MGQLGSGLWDSASFRHCQWLLCLALGKVLRLWWRRGGWKSHDLILAISQVHYGDTADLILALTINNYIAGIWDYKMHSIKMHCTICMLILVVEITSCVRCSLFFFAVTDDGRRCWSRIHVGNWVWADVVCVNITLCVHVVGCKAEDCWKLCGWNCLLSCRRFMQCTDDDQLLFGVDVSVTGRCWRKMLLVHCRHLLTMSFTSPRDADCWIALSMSGLAWCVAVHWSTTFTACARTAAQVWYCFVN